MDCSPDSTAEATTEMIHLLRALLS